VAEASTTAVNEALLHAVREREDAAAIEESEAQAALTRAGQLRKSWGSLSDSLQRGRFVAAHLECQRLLGLSVGDEPSEEALIEELEATLLPIARDIVGSIEWSLPDALESAGLELDASARHPTYGLDKGFVAVGVHADQYVATISTRGGTSRREPLDPEGVAEAVVAVRRRLFGRKRPHFSSGRLRQAYGAVVRQASPDAATDVPIESVRAQLASGRKPIPRDEFNVDLARAVSDASGGTRISLANTRDTRTGYLLYGLEEAGYIGYLRIEDER
jgi:hypothetical protein